ncbi:DUF349 domain-containing protein [Georgenia halophila]|uniref:DUF349 domain-containing protein n=1 Tax=Georgenia halophila TaxID=620889 RepID=A0ABP8LQW9_9MICO
MTEQPTPREPADDEQQATTDPPAEAAGTAATTSSTGSPVPAEPPAEAADPPAEAADPPAEAAEPAEPVAEEAGPADAPQATETDGTTAEPAEAAVEAAEQPALQSAEQPAEEAAKPTPSPKPSPKPRPTPASMPPKPGARAGAGAAAPTPAAVAPTQPAVVPTVDPHAEAEAAAFGRVDDDGTVWVREIAGERAVGQYTGADTEEALGLYIRRFLDLRAQVSLFETRLPQLTPKEIDQTLASLGEALESPAAVGDLDGLRDRLSKARDAAQERREQAAAEREAARAQALAERTVIVEKAEEIAEQDPARTQWKQSGQRLRELLEEWKQAQRNGPRLDRTSEEKLWKRFSHARTAFDRHRRQFFSELDAVQSQVKETKERLIERAQEMSSSTDWGRTTAAYRQLMDEWKAAGRASRKDDDALWARFRAAQQVFFDARNAQNAEIDAEYGQNLEAKLALLEKAEALLPVKDTRAARSALRPIQEQWEEIGKVPRGDVQRIEGRLRAVEQAIRDAERSAWEKSNPETRARAEGAAAQLNEAIEQLQTTLDEARASGDEKRIDEAEAALEARRTWLDQVRRTADRS